MSYFGCLAKEINDQKLFYQHYKNNPSINQRQSSVAIIFKINSNQNWQKYRSQIQTYYIQQGQQPNFNSVCSSQLLNQLLPQIQDNHVQLLLTQRTLHQKDISSGHIVFPGGKCENNQSDLKACIRQTKQQVGITLLQKSADTKCYLNLYLGKLNKNFFYRKYKQQYLFISCHIFLLLESKVTIILNTSELIQSRWINFTHLFDIKKLHLFKDQSSQFVRNIIPKQLSFIKKSILNNIEYVEYPQIIMPLDRNLWGMSFHLWLYMIRMIRFRVQNKQNMKKLDDYISMGEKFRVKFRWYYFPGLMLKYVGQRWNYKNRVKAFEYGKSKGGKMGYMGCLIVIVILCSFGYLYM